MKFKLQAKATIVITTLVEADSEEEAIRIANKREVASIIRDSYYDETEYWLTGEELDTAPREIEVTEKYGKRK